MLHRPRQVEFANEGRFKHSDKIRPARQQEAADSMVAAVATRLCSCHTDYTSEQTGHSTPSSTRPRRPCC